MAETDDWHEYVADLQSNLGYNVRRLRKGRGWTQRQLADRARMHIHTVENVERGGDFRMSVLMRLAVALQARAPELFFQPREFAAIPTFDQDDDR